MRKTAAKHVYTALEMASDAMQILQTVNDVETAAGTLSPEACNLLQSARDHITAAVGDMAKATTK